MDELVGTEGVKVVSSGEILQILRRERRMN